MSDGPGHPEPPAEGPPSGSELARRIEALAERVHTLAEAAVRGLSPEEAVALAPGLDAATRPDASGLGWWVLAVGAALDPEDFPAREAAREALLETVRRAGVLLSENVWVWDASGRALLVLATLPTLTRAGRVAERLRRKGLDVAVRRELPERGTVEDK